MITEAFLKSEIQELEKELEASRVFSIKAEAVLDVYKMLLLKFDNKEEPNGNLS